MLSKIPQQMIPHKIETYAGGAEASSFFPKDWPWGTLSCLEKDARKPGNINPSY